jgi:hypothetical protein
VPATPTPSDAVVLVPKVVDQAKVAAATESTTGLASATLRSVGEILPVAQPVTDLLGGVVDGAGRAVGGLVRGLGQPR